MNDERPELDPNTDLRAATGPRRYVLFDHHHPHRGRHFDLMVESSFGDWLLDFEGFPCTGSDGRGVTWKYYGPMRGAYLSICLRQTPDLGQIKRRESGIAIVNCVDANSIELRLIPGSLMGSVIRLQTNAISRAQIDDYS